MKIWSKFLPILIILFIVASVSAETGPLVNAKAAVLFNVGTGKVLYSKNPNIIMAPASTTKIMTAIIAIERGNLDRKIKVSRRAASMPGSSMNLHRGEEQTLRDLLYGLLLP